MREVNRLGRASSETGRDLVLAAAQDLRYLLGRGYPRPGAVTFVGNHYQLPRSDRDILSRGVYPDPEATERRARLLGPESIKGRSVGVDGHNVLITLESALTGRTLVDCDDGPVRDIAAAAGSYQPSSVTIEAIDMTLDFLTRQGAASIMFLLDAPISRSGDLAAQIGSMMAGRGLIGRARAVPVPDAELAEFGGLTATSDSVLIDRASHPIDLAGLMIRELKPKVSLTRLKPV